MSAHHTQTLPITEYRILCVTDYDMTERELFDFKEARARYHELCEDYRAEKFELIAVIDA